MMKSIIQGTSLESSGKRYTNHCARKTVVKKLKSAGLERSSIVKVTGHRNEKSLDDYDEADEIEQRQLSNAISAATSHHQDKQLQVSHSSNEHSESSTKAATVQDLLNFMPFTQQFVDSASTFNMPVSRENDQRQCFMNMNSFSNCQVTFNVGSGSPMPDFERLASCFVVV